MSGGNGQSRLFRVVASTAVKNQFVETLHVAEVFGVATEVIAVSKQILGELRINATGFGEPLYELEHTQQQVRMGGIAPLFVTYAVHEKFMTVFIKNFELLINP